MSVLGATSFPGKHSFLLGFYDPSDGDGKFFVIMAHLQPREAGEHTDQAFG